MERQFEPQGRTALRLAHFLSNFLQNVDEYEEFGDLKGDRRLNETQIFAEVIANIMGDSRFVCWLAALAAEAALRFRPHVVVIVVFPGRTLGWSRGICRCVCGFRDYSSLRCLPTVSINNNSE